MEVCLFRIKKIIIYFQPSYILWNSLEPGQWRTLLKSSSFFSCRSDARSLNPKRWRKFYINQKEMIASHNFKNQYLISDQKKEACSQRSVKNRSSRKMSFTTFNRWTCMTARLNASFWWSEARSLNAPRLNKHKHLFYDFARVCGDDVKQVVMYNRKTVKPKEQLEQPKQNAN